MATTAQIDAFMAAVEQAAPLQTFQLMNEGRNGGHAVLRLLYASQDPVTAGMIAQYMGVSTARVAVLLKKLSCKGLIEKRRDPKDARVTIVRLTEKGHALSRQMYEQVRTQAAGLIDRIGIEKLTEFMSTFDQIREYLTASDIKF